MKIIDQIKQRRNLRSAWRALRDASRRLTDDEINAIAQDSARTGAPARALSDSELSDFHRRWADAADKDASRHAEFTPRGTSPLSCIYDWDYSGLPPRGNTDRRQRLLSLARQAGVPSGTPGVLEFAELVAADAMRQEPDTPV